MSINKRKRIDKEDYGFLDYDYYGEYSNDPLYILMLNEQYQILRDSFYKLDSDAKNVLDYFVIQRKHENTIEVNLEEYIHKLRKKYLDMYNSDY